MLTSLSDPNIVSVLGVCLSHPGRQPLTMSCEYGRHGDLYHYLQDHVQQQQSQSATNSRTLSYNRLIHMAAQVASGMKYLEELNFVHRDLATRNCLVGSCKTIKISDFGLSRPCFRSDYFLSQSGCLLPVRWMAWESVLLGRYTAKSDVWSFGVTLWEILTLAREQPYESLTDEQVVANLYKEAKAFKRLPRPRGCPREVGDLMEECWRRDASQRPSFREIHMFLQRKNLGYSPDDEDENDKEKVIDRLV